MNAWSFPRLFFFHEKKGPSNLAHCNTTSYTIWLISRSWDLSELVAKSLYPCDMTEKGLHFRLRVSHACFYPGTLITWHRTRLLIFSKSVQDLSAHMWQIYVLYVCSNVCFSCVTSSAQSAVRAEDRMPYIPWMLHTGSLFCLWTQHRTSIEWKNTGSPQTQLAEWGSKGVGGGGGVEVGVLTFDSHSNTWRIISIWSSLVDNYTH